jgi:uncharacterized membrane protein
MLISIIILCLVCLLLLVLALGFALYYLEEHSRRNEAEQIEKVIDDEVIN